MNVFHKKCTWVVAMSPAVDVTAGNDGRIALFLAPFNMYTLPISVAVHHIIFCITYDAVLHKLLFFLNVVDIDSFLFYGDEIKIKVLF